MIELSIEFKDFLKLVREMRQAQEQFFRERGKEILFKAKKLEQQVDEEVQTLLDEQPKLF